MKKQQQKKQVKKNFKKDNLTSTIAILRNNAI